MILPLALASLNAPAHAFGDCATGVGGQLRAVVRGGLTAFDFVNHRDKAGTDVYRLFVRPAPLGEVAKLSLASAAIAVINCAALEGGSAEAATLRARLAEAVQEAPRNLTADRVQRFYLARMRNAAPDQRQLLSVRERILWAETLELAARLNPSLASDFRKLSADLSLRGQPI
ncbi:MAG: hypothetical protein INF43_00915 [Alphaproteobacteria bacterium]|nr:hypothetical protein [Alphaproteobacteria bacterium]